MFERIMELAAQKGLSVAALERKAGIANGVLCKWKGGGQGATIGSLVKIAKVLEVTVDDLLPKEEKQ